MFPGCVERRASGKENENVRREGSLRSHSINHMFESDTNDALTVAREKVLSWAFIVRAYNGIAAGFLNVIRRDSKSIMRLE